MKPSLAYYLSRGLIATGFGVMLIFLGAPWLIGLGVFALAMAWFLWAPRSGLYVVRPQGGIAALSRDERLASMNNKAARNGFVVAVMALAVCLTYFRVWGGDTVPTAIVASILVLTVLVYAISGFVLRRAG